MLPPDEELKNEKPIFRVIMDNARKMHPVVPMIGSVVAIPRETGRLRIHRNPFSEVWITKRFTYTAFGLVFHLVGNPLCCTHSWFRKGECIVSNLLATYDKAIRTPDSDNFWDLLTDYEAGNEQNKTEALWYLSSILFGYPNNIHVTTQWLFDKSLFNAFGFFCELTDRNWPEALPPKLLRLVEIYRRGNVHTLPGLPRDLWISYSFFIATWAWEAFFKLYFQDGIWATDPEVEDSTHIFWSAVEHAPDEGLDLVLTALEERNGKAYELSLDMLKIGGVFGSPFGVARLAHAYLQRNCPEGPVTEEDVIWFYLAALIPFSPEWKRARDIGWIPVKLEDYIILAEAEDRHVGWIVPEGLVEAIRRRESVEAFDEYRSPLLNCRIKIDGLAYNTKVTQPVIRLSNYRSHLRLIEDPVTFRF